MAVDYINWNSALTTGLATIKAGPKAHRGQIAEIVTDLRAINTRSLQIMVDESGLPDIGNAVELVVDRTGLLKVNLNTARSLLADFGPEVSDNAWSAAAAKMRGKFLGSVLAFLSTKILGQYDPFSNPGQLLMNAPTIMEVERKLKVRPHDFRIWVALHEQTHRLQFANAPWLKEELLSHMQVLITADTESAWNKGRATVKQLGSAEFKKRKLPITMVGSLATPEALAAFDKVTAIMSLLEGHAELMMDRGAPKVIHSLPTIRKRFNERRSRGGLVAIMNRLLGMDVKLAQYTTGAKFCREILEQSNLQTLNQVFADPANLPELDELHQPQLWLRRVDG